MDRGVPVVGNRSAVLPSAKSRGSPYATARTDELIQPEGVAEALGLAELQRVLVLLLLLHVLLGRW